MALFVLMALFFSSKGLYRLNLAAREIATSHLPAISTLSELRNVLISQEGYAGKYAIFRSDEFRDLFRKREAAFLEKLAFLKKTGQADQVADLEAGYSRYRQAADRLYAGDTQDTAPLR
ncbi:MAG: methyl-accepting chemotaxis protein, partial [Geobacter sp.]|nr:methyl-accepting chemotaxis protein [Geobacter sp.]